MGRQSTICPARLISALPPAGRIRRDVTTEGAGDHDLQRVGRGGDAGGESQAREADSAVLLEP
ncbi:hypothetical protein [Nocardia spumae]|uniref:hypothetical protein n=1 Tax=Nocardia spumae TaxID=2887190 RepID=UPI001D133E09|nr:hypothetical protein [Nocardia spumae]